MIRIQGVGRPALSRIPFRQKTFPVSIETFAGQRRSALRRHYNKAANPFCTFRFTRQRSDRTHNVGHFVHLHQRQAAHLASVPHPQTMNSKTFHKAICHRRVKGLGASLCTESATKRRLFSRTLAWCVRTSLMSVSSRSPLSSSLLT